MKIYQEKRITRYAKTPDGKTVSAKSTGVDIKGLHYFTSSDMARLNYRATGKVPFSLTEGQPIQFALSDREGKRDILTKEPSDKVVNKLAAERKKLYKQEQEKKSQERKEKSQRKTRKKLKVIKSMGGSGMSDITPKAPMIELVKPKKKQSGGKVHRGRPAMGNKE